MARRVCKAQPAGNLEKHFLAVLKRLENAVWDWKDRM